MLVPPTTIAVLKDSRDLLKALTCNRRVYSNKIHVILNLRNSKQMSIKVGRERIIRKLNVHITFLEHKIYNPEKITNGST